MKAIHKLIRSGLTRRQVADALGLKSAHLIGMYEHDKRFPGRDNFARLVELADSRGILLLASDFIS